MLLAIDIGNTNTHLGGFRDGDLAEHWRFQTGAGATGDEIAERIAGLLALSGIDVSEVDAIVVSSVCLVKSVQKSRRTSFQRRLPAEISSSFSSRLAVKPYSTSLAKRYYEVPCLTVGPRIKTGMPIRIDNPYEVGADRLVNAIAAYDRIAGACVVVDFGTGINFDAVSADGEYLGGAIAPGVEISLAALTERGARIPSIELAEPETAIGKSTRGAIQSGVIFGFAGLIDGVARRVERELGGDPTFIATGGLAGAIAPFCEMIDEVDDLLTLKGLKLIWERNA